MTKNASARSKGFSLFENLIALLVFSIGMLGFATLQIKSIKSVDSAQLRSQAVSACYEILDRIRVNSGAAINGDYNIGLSKLSDLSTPDTSIAQIDRDEWFRTIDSFLPVAKGAIHCTSGGICLVTVEWDDTRAAQAFDPASGSTDQRVVFSAQI